MATTLNTPRRASPETGRGIGVRCLAERRASPKKVSIDGSRAPNDTAPPWSPNRHGMEAWRLRGATGLHLMERFQMSCILWRCAVYLVHSTEARAQYPPATVRASFIHVVMGAGLRYRPSDGGNLAKKLLDGRLRSLACLHLGQFAVRVEPDVIAPRDEGLSLCRPFRLC